MSRNDLTVREQEARSIVGAKAKQISVLVGKDEAKTSKFMSALVQLSQNKNLIDCRVDSIVDVGFQIVQAGLNPNPLFGQAYVVPFNLKSGFTVAQLQVGYKGYIQLGYRAGWKFKAVPVYKCDKFDYKFGGFEDDIVLEPNYDGRNEDVFKMLRSSAAILHGINNLRNNYSMAHPTETLLNEADARFAINLVRSIMTYVDELL